MYDVAHQRRTEAREHGACEVVAGCYAADVAW